MGLYFNLNEDERAFARLSEIHCLVIYDIASNKRRRQLAHLLEAFGVRVQKSCFEIRLDKIVYQSLLSHLKEFYQLDQEDHIRVYKVRQDEKIVFDVAEGEVERERQIFYD